MPQTDTNIIIRCNPEQIDAPIGEPTTDDKDDKSIKKEYKPGTPRIALGIIGNICLLTAFLNISIEGGKSAWQGENYDPNADPNMSLISHNVAGSPVISTAAATLGATISAWAMKNIYYWYTKEAEKKQADDMRRKQEQEQERTR